MNQEFAINKIKKYTYDLSMISLEELFSSPGFEVQIKHYEHILINYPERLDWNLGKMKEMIKKEGYNIIDVSHHDYVRFYFRKMAKASKLERSRLNYGTQVARNIGMLIDKVGGIRVIGAESRLEARSKERSINDLDLGIDLIKPLTSQDIELMFWVKQDAEKKTGIVVDLLGKDIPVTENAMEHLFGFFSGPLSLRGFPVYWRCQEYLDNLLKIKNEYYDSQMVEVKKQEEQLRRMGIQFKI